MRLNLGCGDRYASGWHNVDHAGSPHHKDETVDLTGPLPWWPHMVELAYAGHVLEHLPMGGVLDLLERLWLCMRPGGILMVVGPDLVRAQAMAEAGTLDVTMDSLRYGASRWPGDEHRWECAPELIVSALKASGWRQVVEVPFPSLDPLWPVADRGPQWQCAVQGEAS